MKVGWRDVVGVFALITAIVLVVVLRVQKRSGGSATTTTQIVTQVPATQPDADALVIRQLRAAGSDLTKPHEIDFYLYFPSEPAARAAADRIKSDFTTTVRHAAKGDQWLVLAHRTMIPREQDLAQIRTRLSRLAEQSGGEYDGWEAEVRR